MGISVSMIHILKISSKLVNGAISCKHLKVVKIVVFHDFQPMTVINVRILASFNALFQKMLNLFSLVEEKSDRLTAGHALTTYIVVMGLEHIQEVSILCGKESWYHKHIRFSGYQKVSIPNDSCSESLDLILYNTVMTQSQFQTCHQMYIFTKYCRRGVSNHQLRYRSILSWVWNYFKHNDEDYEVECNVCAKRLKFSKCTTNMIKHANTHGISKEFVAQDTTEEYTPYTENDVGKKKIDELILNLITVDLQPFSIVEDIGFKNLLNFLDPKYILPTRKTLKTLLHERYVKEKVRVREELQNTCHFVNHNFELKTYVIETKKFTGNHTASTIANRLDEIMIKWDIQNKVTAVVTDNAANTRTAMKQLCVPTTDKLNEVQIMLSLLQYKLKSEVPTRSNATYEMFDRLLKLKSSIVIALSSLKINFEKLTDREWDTLPNIVQLLKPFFLITEELSSEKYVSISKLVLIKKQLYIFIDTYQDEGGIAGTLCTELRLQLDNDSISTAHRKEFQETVTGEGPSFWSIFDIQVLQKNTIACKSGVSGELNNYMKEPYLSRHENPWMFWKDNTLKYPILSKLAKEYLCVMARSVPPERVFSKTGEIIFLFSHVRSELTIFKASRYLKESFGNRYFSIPTVFIIVSILTYARL
ncbi:E3 SUMO-protein ligase ZBED1-like [Halictus rubicundus]|uniref:E3 SUMO-protein ligase ZBED1-like n=1 Tax=Halictus rubicundus TaxID=77578 RepID=UPI004035021F